MAKYHVNPETGDVSVCRATKKCPFGDANHHYGTQKEALMAAEEMLEEEFPDYMASLNKEDFNQYPYVDLDESKDKGADLIEITENGVKITSPWLLTQFREMNLSPTTINELEECPAKFAATRVIDKAIPEDVVDSDLARGNLYHKVMERFFAEDQQNRTRERLEEVKQEVLSSREFEEMSKSPEVNEWLDSTIQGYYDLGGDPENVDLVYLPNRYYEDVEDPAVGIHIEGRIGNSRRTISGHIDRLRYARDGSVIVEDWKTGKFKPYDRNKELKNQRDGYKAARQQNIYAQLLQQKGFNVSQANLIYPAARKTATAPLDKEFSDRVTADVEAADKKLDGFTEKGEFGFSPDFKCAWCKLAKACPKARVVQSEKGRAAYDSQPDAEQLRKVFKF